MKKLLLAILLVLGLVAVYKFGLLNKNYLPSQKSANAVKKITVQQKITGQAEFSSQQIEEGKTALDLLNETESAVTTGEKENAYVVGINGIKAEEEKKEFWAFYINGKQAAVGAGSYKLKDGDKIEWKKENY